MAKRKNIVAAELLGIKEKMSLVDAIAFPVAGDHIAGLAGALVGAALTPSKLIYSYRVLYDDGTYGKLKCNGDDPRNNTLMELPYIPDYEAYRESEAKMTEGAPMRARLQYAAPSPENVAAPQEAPIAQQQPSGGGIVIGAGYYEFGGNFPQGMFDLEYVSGEGVLELKDKIGLLDTVELGENGKAKSFSGLSSNEYKWFKLDGSLQVKVTRATMIQI